MEQRGDSRADQNATANNSVISSDVLNRCISGRRGGRSIFSPRLLAPGGAKKRVFLPNIPTRQEKPKENIPQEEVKEARGSSGRGHRSRGRGENNNRGRGAELIQTKGVFGDGRHTRTMKKERVPRYSERSSGDGGSIMQVPKFTPVVETKSDDEEDNESLRKLFKDDFLYDSDSDELTPVILPIVNTMIKCKKEEIEPNPLKVKIKQEPDDDMQIKDEMMDFDYEMNIKKENDIKNIKTEIKHENEIKKEDSFAELFTNHSTYESGELLFFHFPDCLPRNSITDEDEDAEKSKQETEANNDDECQNTCRWSLKDVPEGLVGKLQILKSGRVRLKVGTLYFDVTKGPQVGFLEQVVSLKMTDNSGDLHVLGRIKSKVVCFPNLDNMTSCKYT